MTIPSWSPEAKARAKGERRYLVKMELNGRYAETGPTPGATIGVAAEVKNDAQAFALMGLIQALTFGPGTVPETMREATLAGMLELLEMMLEERSEPTKLTATLEMLRETFGLMKPKDESLEKMLDEAGFPRKKTP